jgi:hypothetical protein
MVLHLSIGFLGRQPSPRQCKLLIRALQIAATIATSGVPHITLAEDQCFHQKLRGYKHRGFLATTKLDANDMIHLWQILSDFEPQLLYSEPDTSDSFQLIVDTGCSHSATGCVDDFLPNTIHDLEQPLEMEGIASDLLIR